MLNHFTHAFPTTMVYKHSSFSLTNDVFKAHQLPLFFALLNWSLPLMPFHSTINIIFRHLVSPWVVNLAQVMPASSLATRNSLSTKPMTALCLASSKGTSTTSLEQPLFPWPISRISSTTLTIFIQPCNSHILSPKKACHFWTSSLASPTTRFPHPSTTKPTDAHCLLNYESSHPKKCKDSIPYSQMRRLRRVCSDDDDFNSKASEMSSFFKRNNYPDHITQAAFNKVKDLSQDDALRPSNNENSNHRIPFTLTYHPFNSNIKNIIYNNFNILTDDTKTKNIFNAPPLMAFRRDKNLKDSLVRTNFKTMQQPGTSPCQHRLCLTCTHVNQSTTIINQNRSFNIRCNFTCSSSCVIYCIICTKCQSFYIGETSRQINNRFGEHMRNVRNKIYLKEDHENDPDSNISRHFNSANHSTADMSILGLLYASQDSTKRKTLEKRLIFSLKTLYPNGLNKQFTYLQ